MSKRKHAIEAFLQRGVQLHAAGRLAEAEQVYRQVLAAAPAHADALHMLGVLALQSGQPQAALGLIDQAIGQKPTMAPYHVNRANVLLALGRPDEAIDACQTALRFKRNSGEAHQLLGHILSDLGRPEEAIAAYHEALRLQPALPDLYNSLGLALRDANRLDEAVAALRTALRREPRDAQARGNLANVLKELGQLPEADSEFREALRLQPDDAVTHMNHAMMLLLAGKLADGWQEWEWRWRARPDLQRPFRQPQWQGDPLNGRTLLVYAEQGIGSNIQFSRYVDLIPTGGRVLLETHPSLRRLFGTLASAPQVVAVGDTLPRFDVQIPLLSLPRVLGTASEQQVPAAVPYLHADPALVARWGRRTAALDGLRVGLVWAGNPEDVRMDRRRSLGPDRIAPLASVPGVSLVSLQKGGPAGSPLPQQVHDWTDELADFADTAALIETLDLVIGVDTAVVHLAGALAKPVWLLNRFDTDWRWLLGRDDSPWYPTLRQFRQPSAGDWDNVMLTVRDALARFALDRLSATS